MAGSHPEHSLVEGASMRRFIAIASLVFTAGLAMGQTAPAARPSNAAKPATHAASADTIAIIDTTVGKMTCTLFPEKAPIGVANFVGLATGTKDWKNPVSGVTKHGVPLYDGTIFHRVIPGFMIQGGDPAGNGTGDPGYKFKDEIVSGLTFDKAGRLAMANSGPNTNGSQFFITEVPTPHLNGHYNLFGQCDEPSVELVKKIARMARDPRDDRPFRPVRITHITIVSASSAAAPAAKPGKPAAKKPSRGRLTHTRRLLSG